MVLFLDDAAFRILDLLAKNLGKPFSIRALNDGLSSKNRKAYYANTYNQVSKLSDKRILKLTRIGRARSVELDFSSDGLIPALAEMELLRGLELFDDSRLAAIRKHLGALFFETPFLGAACIIRDSQALALNKIELLFILRSPSQGNDAFNPTYAPPSEGVEEQRAFIAGRIQSLASKTNLRIDFLALTCQEFLNELFSPQANPVKLLVKDEIAVFNPGFFWMLVEAGKACGLQFSVNKDSADSRKLKREDILLAFGRHGYREFGAASILPSGYSIETAIAAALVLEDARLLEAIPVILAKDERKRINYALLEYLARKCGKAELYGFLLENAIEFSKLLKTSLTARKCLERMKNGHGSGWDVRLQLRKADLLEKMVLYHAC